MRDFFSIAAPRDFVYRVSRDHEQAASYTRNLFAKSEPYLDDDRPEAAANDFHPVWWELYLAASLLDLGVPLVAKPQRRHRRGGPDLQVEHERAACWIEAIAATRGTGDDAVPEVDYSWDSPAKIVPDRRLLLRISHAVAAKARKYQEYHRNGDVGTGEPFVIAVNGGFLPLARLETDVPRIARVLFGIGELTLYFDADTREFVGENHPPMPSVKKLNNSEVELAFFAKPEYSFVSAVIWGTADVANRPEVLGRDLLLVHNPNAAVPLRRGWFREGSEYWADNGELRNYDWWREVIGGTSAATAG